MTTAAGTLTADQQRFLEQMTPQQVQVAARLLTGRQTATAALSAQQQKHPSYHNSQGITAGNATNRLVYEDIDMNHDRAKVPGGWIVRAHTGVLSGREVIGIVFVPDINHTWR